MSKQKLRPTHPKLAVAPGKRMSTGGHTKSLWVCTRESLEAFQHCGGSNWQCHTWTTWTWWGVMPPGRKPLAAVAQSSNTRKRKSMALQKPVIAGSALHYPPLAPDLDPSRSRRVDPLARGCSLGHLGGCQTCTFCGIQKRNTVEMMPAHTQLELI